MLYLKDGSEPRYPPDKSRRPLRRARCRADGLRPRVVKAPAAKFATAAQLQRRGPSSPAAPKRRFPVVRRKPASRKAWPDSTRVRLQRLLDRRVRSRGRPGRSKLAEKDAQAFERSRSTTKRNTSADGRRVMVLVRRCGIPASGRRLAIAVDGDADLQRRIGHNPKSRANPSRTRMGPTSRKRPTTITR